MSYFKINILSTKVQTYISFIIFPTDFVCLGGSPTTMVENNPHSSEKKNCWNNHLPPQNSLRREMAGRKCGLLCNNNRILLPVFKRNGVPHYIVGVRRCHNKDTPHADHRCKNAEINWHQQGRNGRGS